MVALKFCENISRITKNSVTLNSIPKGDFRHSVKIGEAHNFLSELNPNDLERFKISATFSIESRPKDGRSVTLPLVVPIEINGEKIQSLRLKGVLPNANENGEVLPYTEGNGYVPTLIKVIGKNKIYAVQKRDALEYSPWGTMSSLRLGKEIETALLMGPKVTDHLLGFGVYPELTFCGEPVGFAIYGMEGKENTRVMGHFIDHIKAHGDLPYEDLAANTGMLLRKMHEAGLIHRYPHLFNYRMVSPNEARILDLDTTIKLDDVPAEERPAYLYLSISRAINDYMKYFPFMSKYDDTIETEYVYLTRLLPFFLSGYFNHDASLPFVRETERYTEKDCNDEELHKAFGMLPEYECGYRSSEVGHSLVEPVINLYSADGLASTNLESYKNKNPLFGLFYDALERIAGSI